MLPFLVGVTALVGTWASGIRPDVGVLAGLAGALGSAGAFYTKLLLKGDKYAEKAIAEMQDETHGVRERALDDLETRLVADGDPRTESALRDLRSLTRAFEELRDNPELELNARSMFDIASGVQELFEQCVRSLERTLKLWHTGQELVTKAARQPIYKQREQILHDVASSIRQLGQVLGAIQNLGAGGGGESKLARIGKQLDQHLAVARQVEQRVNAFEKQLDSGLRE